MPYSLWPSVSVSKVLNVKLGNWGFLLAFWIPAFMPQRVCAGMTGWGDAPETANRTAMNSNKNSPVKSYATL